MTSSRPRKGGKVNRIDGYVRSLIGRGLNNGGYTFVWHSKPESVDAEHLYEIHHVRVEIRPITSRGKK